MPRLTQRQPHLGLLTTGYFSDNPSKPEGGSQLMLKTTLCLICRKTTADTGGGPISMS